MEQRLTIITLGVNNLIDSTEFYTKTLGWEPTSDSNENITFIKLNGILLALYPKEKLAEDAGSSALNTGINSLSMAYIGKNKEEVDDIFNMLKQKGVTITKEPEAAFWGGYSGYFSDPDGNLWEVAHNPFLTLDTDGSVA